MLLSKEERLEVVEEACSRVFNSYLKKLGLLVDHIGLEVDKLKTDLENIKSDIKKIKEKDTISDTFELASIEEILSNCRKSDDGFYYLDTQTIDRLCDHNYFNKIKYRNLYDFTGNLGINVVGKVISNDIPGIGRESELIPIGVHWESEKGFDVEDAACVFNHIINDKSIHLYDYSFDSFLIWCRWHYKKVD